MEIIERSGVGRVWAEDGMNRDGTEDFEAVKLSCILYKDRYVHMSKSVECTPCLGVHEPGMKMHIYNPSTGEVMARGQKLKDNLGYMTACFKKKSSCFLPTRTGFGMTRKIPLCICKGISREV